MSQSKREQVVSHLRYIRQEPREMHQGVMEDGLLPEAGEVRGVMAQMRLLELLGASRPERRKLRPNNFSASACKTRKPGFASPVPIIRSGDDLLLLEFHYL